MQNYYFITFLSLVVLAIIEYAKRFTIKAIAVSYFKKSLSLGNTLLFLVLFGVSIYAAVTGAVEYTKSQTDKSEEITDATNDELKDVSSDYKRQIRDAQNDLKAFKKSVTWHGAINTSDKKTMDVIDKKEATIDKLQEALEKDKEHIRKNKAEKITKNSASVETSSVRIFCFSLVVELVSLLYIGFIYYFLGTTHIDNFIESNDIETSHNVTQTSDNDIKTSKNVTKTSKNEQKNNVTIHRNDIQPLRYDDNTLTKPSKNNDDRVIVNGFVRNDIQPLRNDNTEKKATCKNCKATFEQKNARHIYCSNSCRLEAWEAKKGVTVFGSK